MKKTIIDSLIFPRLHVRNNIDLDKCKHAGSFNAVDQDCVTCKNGYECKWLLENDECVSMESKSVEQLVKALEFSLEYFDSKIAGLGHDVDKCQCDACRWMNDAEDIYADYYHAYPGVIAGSIAGGMTVPGVLELD